jgi:mannose-6-phosphate isomerase-like protein (cupin superfamily)
MVMLSGRPQQATPLCLLMALFLARSLRRREEDLWTEIAQCSSRSNSRACQLGTLVLRLENFPTIEMAQRVSTPASAVVEARGKVWLLTLSSKGERSPGGECVIEVGPVPPIPQAATYEMDVAEADFGADIRAAVARAVHTHPGPEMFYLLSGEQCLETPSGAMHARAGEGMVAPANTPMQLNIMGSSKRDAFFVVIHDSTKPRVTPSQWQPEGICAK